MQTHPWEHLRENWFGMELILLFVFISWHLTRQQRECISLSLACMLVYHGLHAFSVFLVKSPCLLARVLDQGHCPTSDEPHDINHYPH